MAAKCECRLGFLASGRWCKPTVLVNSSLSILSSVLYSIAEPDKGPDRAETSQLSCGVQCRDCDVLL